MKNKKGLLKEYAEAIVTALILALVIRAYVVQAFKIPSGSMIPTLLIGDHILVNKFIYGTKIPFSAKRVLVFKKPERGDIIVFKYPENPEKDFIKRVVATGGDVIEERNKSVYVNKKAAAEPYVQHSDSSVKAWGNDPRDNFGPFKVPKDAYFVMGDNRDRSLDSRFWGIVPKDLLVGRALILYFSWNGKSEDLLDYIRWTRIGKLIK